MLEVALITVPKAIKPTYYCPFLLTLAAILYKKTYRDYLQCSKQSEHQHSQINSPLIYLGQKQSHHKSVNTSLVNQTIVQFANKFSS